ncbi:hypothetical protein GQE99_15115 [Maritimibacter sp. DP07]|uniref:Xylulokinase n=1 Tax=Maritimibacter harenae TaxID=2606218 RepID=A0A845M8U6_9RHOB|nr:FGGY family carbohydrate kinase [Maritimibacter harenae]MZR14347.1 hypothetical protein [Maritimibacter harenae]
MTKVALGIDFGTSSVKAVALTENGEVVAEANAPYPMHRAQPQYAEQAPADWMAAMRKVTRAIARSTEPDRIAAIGLSGQLNGIVRCSPDGTPVGMALTWLDQRAEAATQVLAEKFEDSLYEITGNRANAIAAATKLRFLSETSPAHTGPVLQVKDWIAFRLTGEMRTERNEASGTLLMDFSASRWDKSLCDWAGVSRDQLPPIGNATDRLPPLKADIAETLGLPPGIPVVLGAGDTGALAVGCGAFAPGVVAVTLGTAGHVVAASPLPPAHEVHGMWRMGHVSPDRELWLGLIPAGALSMEWLRDIFAFGGRRPDFKALEAAARAVDPTAVEAMFLPFLAGAGTPWSAPAKAVLSGLDLSQGPGHLIHAVQTGVAHAIAASINEFSKAGLAIDTVRLAEGGARSQVWCQTIADVIGREVEILSHGDTSAVGAALIAFAGVSDAPASAALDDIIAQAVRPMRRFVPDRDRHDFHRSRHDDFISRANEETLR